MQFLLAFVIGGLFCALGQILMDRTQLTPAHVMVLFVTVGAILGGFGLYQHLVEWAGAGATVPLPGFGNALATGVQEAVDQQGLIGIFTGVLKPVSAGLTAAICFGFVAALIFNPKG